MTPLLHATLAMVLAAPGSLPVYSIGSEQSAPAKEHYRAHVTFDTAALGEEQAPKEVEQQQDLFSRKSATIFGPDIKLSDEPSDDTAEVQVVVRWADFADFRYGVTIHASTPDGRSEETSFDFQGDAHDLVERLKDEVPTVLAWLERPTDAAPPEVAGDPPHETPPTPAPSPSPDEPRLHGLGKAGIGVAAVGLAAGATGAVLFSMTEPKTRLDGGSRTSAEDRRFPKASVGLMAGGGVAVVAGLALLVVDLKRSKTPKSRASLTPVFSTQGAGLSLHGRF